MHHNFPLTGFVINFGLGYVLGVVLHELGHFAFAKLAGLPVAKVVIGARGLLCAFSLGRVDWEIRVLPLAGRVIIEPSVYQAKYRSILMVSGGVMANAAFAVILHFVWDVPFVPTKSDLPLQGLMWSQILLIAGTLYPRIVKTQDGQVATDGYQIAHYLKQPQIGLSLLGEGYLRLLGPYAKMSRVQDALSPASDRLAVLPLKILQLDTRDQIAAFRSEAGKDDHSQAEELLILDGLMTRTLKLSEYDPVELCEWAEHALMLGPDIPTIQFTVGGVLIELGQYTRGINSIEAAIGVDDKPFDTVIRTTYLARAEHALGNHEKAKALAQSALKLAYLTDRIGGGDHDGFLRATEAFLRKMDTALSTCDNGHPSMTGQAHAPSQ